MNTRNLKILSVFLILSVITLIFLFSRHSCTVKPTPSHAVWHIKGTTSQSIEYKNSTYHLTKIGTPSGSLSDSVFVLQGLTRNLTQELVYNESDCIDTLNYKLCFLIRHEDDHNH